FLLLMIPHLVKPLLFPYTTLFRSSQKNETFSAKPTARNVRGSGMRRADLAAKLFPADFGAQLGDTYRCALHYSCGEELCGQVGQIGRAHVCTPGTYQYRMQTSA